MRKEKDFLGVVEIEETALYGVSSYRARINFPHSKPFSKKWYCSLGSTKKACYLTLLDLFLLLESKNIDSQFKELNFTVKKIEALIRAASEMEAGEHFEYFIVPAISGGAGTSINMNINEILANRALVISGYQRGEYTEIDPVIHANVFQSTNDIVPTSLRVTVLKLLKTLEKNIVECRNPLESLEEKYRHTMRIAYTQLQEAVPTTWGRLFSTYAEAFTRDWWRVSKSWERIKVVNLGGGAIGSGLAIPRYYIFHVNAKLAELTDLPLVRSENLQDATSNLDMWVEIHGIQKALAVNMVKMVSDLRLLASDFHKEHKLTIPCLQVGSSIMPGKVNPVIPEYIISICEKVFANDSLITRLCSQGQLDLNAYLPLIGETFIESLELLIAGLQTIKEHLLTGLKIETDLTSVLHSPSIATVVIPYLGYHQGEKLAHFMKEKKVDIIKANEVLKLIDPKVLLELIDPKKLLELGYSFKKENKEGSE